MKAIQRRGKAYRRAQTKRVIKRRENILRKVYGIEPEEWFSHKNGASHRLDKAKVHCSCPMCSAKTKTQGWKHSDLQKMQTGDYGDDEILEDE